MVPVGWAARICSKEKRSCVSEFISSKAKRDMWHLFFLTVKENGPLEPLFQLVEIGEAFLMPVCQFVEISMVKLYLY